MRQFRGVDPQSLAAIQTVQRLANAWGDTPQPKQPESAPEPEAVIVKDATIEVSSDDFIWKTSKFLKELTAAPDKRGLIQSPLGDVDVTLTPPKNVKPVLLKSHDLRAKGIHQAMAGIGCAEVKLSIGSLFLTLSSRNLAMESVARAEGERHILSGFSGEILASGKLADLHRSDGTLDQRIIRKPFLKLTNAFLKKAVADIADPAVAKTVYRGRSNKELEASDGVEAEKRVWRPDAGFYIERVVRNWEEAIACKEPCIIAEKHPDHPADKVAIVTGLNDKPIFDHAEYALSVQKHINKIDYNTFFHSTLIALSRQVEQLQPSERIYIDGWALIWRPGEMDIKYGSALEWEDDRPSYLVMPSAISYYINRQEPVAIKKSKPGEKSKDDIAFIITPMSYDL